MPAAGFAGTSANYSLVPDAVDSGGLRGTSASYSLNASAMAGGAGASSGYTTRTGFAGQLEDPVSGGAVPIAIRITALPAALNEAGSRQLAAFILNNDGRLTPLAADSVSWSVQSGPLTGISAGGLATAAGVYQDSAALVRGTWESFAATVNLTVLNTLPDNFSTYAGDGLPDDWQVQYFGLNNAKAAPMLDPDGDGWDNLFEYHACLNPADRFSTFSLHISDAPGGGHQVTFSPRLPDCIYSLQGSNDLRLWTPVAGATSDAGSLRTILDPAGAGRRRFYFMEVRRQ